MWWRYRKSAPRLRKLGEAMNELEEAIQNLELEAAEEMALDEFGDE